VKISFVIPAYNEEKLIGQCIESVRKELASGAYDAEVLVVNNASTDRTREIAASFPDVRVVDEMRKGITRARQAGYLASSGELIANIDADTIMPEGWVARVMKEFEGDPKLVALSGPFIYYDLSVWERALIRSYLTVGFLLHLLYRDVLHVGAFLQGGNFVLRRAALEKAGGFDTNIEFYGEDTAIAKRMSRVGKVKWTFKLPIYTSGRRLAQEGLLRVGIDYAINFFWTTFIGKPLTKKYADVRVP
jgi:glycosyltransferase involved in cell wall biosynthesis